MSHSWVWWRKSIPWVTHGPFYVLFTTTTAIIHASIAAHCYNVSVFQEKSLILVAHNLISYPESCFSKDVFFSFDDLICQDLTSVLYIPEVANVIASSFQQPEKVHVSPHHSSKLHQVTKHPFECKCMSAGSLLVQLNTTIREWLPQELPY